MHNSLKLAAVLVAVTATAASAQGNGRNTNRVPPGQRPPDGMCRVWVTGVAPGQQSAPTDCATAEARARVTANSRVIYGGFPGKKGSHANDDLLTRRRQLADGSWVVDRYRRDANGNLTIVSTRPIGVNGVTKAERKAEKRQLKAERKSEKREMKNERDDDRDEMRGMNRDDHNEMRGTKHEGKGKGKHEKEDRDDDDNDNG
jgi:hypothetical protein